jgi:hypothetical protein
MTPRLAALPLPIVIALLAGVACSGSSAPASPDSGTSLEDASAIDTAVAPDVGRPIGDAAADVPPPVPPGAIVLKVLRAAESTRVGTDRASAGYVYVDVDLEIANGTRAPISIGHGRFEIAVRGGLLRPAAFETNGVARGCPDDARLRGGERTRCRVLFEVPRGEQATAIEYGSDQRASAPLSVIPCTECRDGCLDVTGDDRFNCGACEKVTKICIDGKPFCEEPREICGDKCVDVLTDPENCGGCGNRVGAGVSCVGGRPGCAAKNEILCRGTCIANTDPTRCGSCDRVCTAGFRCKRDDAGFFCAERTTVRASCAAVCKGLRCRKTVHRFQCDAGLGQYEDDCDDVAPASLPGPGGSTCTFLETLCDCD